MTLEKHMVDTLKEWQIKIGSLDSDMRLYYPKQSLCRHLSLDTAIDNTELKRNIEQHWKEHAGYLGEVGISYQGDRFCLLIGKAGCDYIEKEVEEPEFLTGLLEVLKLQDMQRILNYFEDYAHAYGTKVCVNKEEEEHETVLFFENEEAEPYVYCIDQNEFGITYHRFTKEDYKEL